MSTVENLPTYPVVPEPLFDLLSLDRLLPLETSWRRLLFRLRLEETDGEYPSDTSSLMGAPPTFSQETLSLAAPLGAKFDLGPMELSLNPEAGYEGDSDEVEEGGDDDDAVSIAGIPTIALLPHTCYYYSTRNQPRHPLLRQRSNCSMLSFELESQEFETVFIRM